MPTQLTTYAPTSVTSRGCSKAFMIVLFYRAFEHALNCKDEQIPFGWPYPHKAIEEWIMKARKDMRDTLHWDQM